MHVVLKVHNPNRMPRQALRQAMLWLRIRNAYHHGFVSLTNYPPAPSCCEALCGDARMSNPKVEGPIPAVSNVIR